MFLGCAELQGRWYHSGWVNILHNQSGGGGGGLESCSHQQDQQCHHTPSHYWPHSPTSTDTITWHRILSTQQEVALQTVCFVPFLRRELKGLERVKQKENALRRSSRLTEYGWCIILSLQSVINDICFRWEAFITVYVIFPCVLLFLLWLYDSILIPKLC